MNNLTINSIATVNFTQAQVATMKKFGYDVEALIARGVQPVHTVQNCCTLFVDDNEIMSLEKGKLASHEVQVVRECLYTKSGKNFQPSHVICYFGDDAVLSTYCDMWLTTSKFHFHKFNSTCDKISQFQNVMFIGNWAKCKEQIKKRLGFQSYRANYKCYWLDESCKNHKMDWATYNEMEQLAMKYQKKATWSSISKSQWITLFDGIAKFNKNYASGVQMYERFSTNRNEYQKLVDTCRAWLDQNEKANKMDRFHAGHIEMVDKHNYYKSISSHEKENGVEYTSCDDKQKMVYVVSDYEMLCDTLTAMYCISKGIEKELDGTVGNGGRVTREYLQDLGCELENYDAIAWTDYMSDRYDGSARSAKECLAFADATDNNIYELVELDEVIVPYTYNITGADFKARCNRYKAMVEKAKANC